MATTTKDFHHPFQPYEIQNQLMNAVYDCISEGKVGIFESPTGTGKSLSLICSTLSWLRDEQKKIFDSDVSLEGDDEEPAWIMEQARRQRTEMLVQRRLDLESRLNQIREAELRQKRQYKKGEPAKKQAKLNQRSQVLEVEHERHFLLEDYRSEDEKIVSSTSRNHDEGLSAATLHLMKQLGEPVGPSEADSDPELLDELKVFFCSRTHSQLIQIVSELRRVKVADPPWHESGNDLPQAKDQQYNVIKHLSLGSRKSLCINSKVVNAGSTATINERCLDLQQPSTPQEKRCPFLPNKENQVLVNEFRDHTLAKVRDIEELGALGNRIGICPYYSARKSIRPSEVGEFLCMRQIKK